MDRIAIFGAAGFSREVRDIVWALGATNICFLGFEHEMGELDGFPIFEDEATTIAKLTAQGWQFAIGIGQPAIRKRIAERNPDLSFPSLIHPTASFGWHQRERVEAASGAIIAAGARFMSNVGVGRQVIVSLNTTIGHDVVLGDYSAIMPNVSISGNVTLGEGVYVGVGATTLNGQPDKPLLIGAGATIGAGAVVVKDVAPGDTITGVPGKPRSN